MNAWHSARSARSKLGNLTQSLTRQIPAALLEKWRRWTPIANAGAGGPEKDAAGDTTSVGFGDLLPALRKNTPLPPGALLRGRSRSGWGDDASPEDVEFRVTDLMAWGGTSFVYRAVNVQSGEWVAVKEFMPQSLLVRAPTLWQTAAQITPHWRPESSSTDPFTAQLHRLSDKELGAFVLGLDRFAGEAAVMKAVERSPQDKILSHFECHGTGYIVMPLRHGTTLSQWLHKRAPSAAHPWTPLETPLLVRWARELIQEMRCVHRAGFMHLDIKPGNIWLDVEAATPSESAHIQGATAAHAKIRLMDFGNAREIIGGRGLGAFGAKINKGRPMYTPRYAPTEQQKKGSNTSTDPSNIGPWSDVYAVGATLFHLLTGETPIQAPNQTHAHNFKEALAQQPHLPTSWARLLAALLDPSVDHRAHLINHPGVLDALCHEVALQTWGHTDPTSDGTVDTMDVEGLSTKHQSWRSRQRVHCASTDPAMVTDFLNDLGQR